MAQNTRILGFHYEADKDSTRQFLIDQTTRTLRITEVFGITELSRAVPLIEEKNILARTLATIPLENLWYVHLDHPRPEDNYLGTLAVYFNGLVYPNPIAKLFNKQAQLRSQVLDITCFPSADYPETSWYNFHDLAYRLLQVPDHFSLTGDLLGDPTRPVSVALFGDSLRLTFGSKFEILPVNLLHALEIRPPATTSPIGAVQDALLGNNGTLKIWFGCESPEPTYTIAFLSSAFGAYLHLSMAINRLGIKVIGPPDWLRLFGARLWYLPKG